MNGRPPRGGPELVVVDGHPTMVWRLVVPHLAIASAPLGGGLGLRSWVINVQVPHSYGRFDIDAHLTGIADALGLDGPGVGFLTAATVDRWTTAADGPARVDGTVGIGVPTWAAADDAEVPLVGTINLIGRLDRRMGDAAMVNAVATVTEAKTQALLAEGVAGTGTASDAICLLCPADGAPESFGGPRSAVGAPLARATFETVVAGVRRYREEWPDWPAVAGCPAPAPAAAVDPPLPSIR